MSVTREQLLAWFDEVFWLVFSEGARLDRKPGKGILAMSPLGAIKEFRFTENDELVEIEELK